MKTFAAEAIDPTISNYKTSWTVSGLQGHEIGDEIWLKLAGTKDVIKVRVVSKDGSTSNLELISKNGVEIVPKKVKQAPPKSYGPARRSRW